MAPKSRRVRWPSASSICSSAGISAAKDCKRELQAAPRSQILSQPIKPFLEMDAAELAGDWDPSSTSSAGRLLGLPEQ